MEEAQADQTHDWANYATSLAVISCSVKWRTMLPKSYPRVEVKSKSIVAVRALGTLLDKVVILLF